MQRWLACTVFKFEKYKMNGSDKWPNYFGPTQNNVGQNDAPDTRNLTPLFHVGFCNEGSIPLYVVIALHVLLVPLGVLGNFLVVLVVCKTKRMQNPTNLLLSNNAIAEMLYLTVSGVYFTIFTLMVNTDTFTRTHVVNILLTSGPLSMIAVAPFLVSMVNLALLSIERYNGLCNPMKIHRKLGKRSAKLCMIIMWITAIILVLPVTVSMINGRGIMPYHFWIYHCSTCAVTSAIAGCIIVYCYGRIIHGIYVSKTIFKQTCSASLSDDIKAKRKIVKLLLSITITFIVMKLPNAAYTAVFLFLTLNRQTECVVVALETLGHFSAFLNPIIYLVFCSNYRQGTMKLFKSCFHKRGSVERKATGPVPLRH